MTVYLHELPGYRPAYQAEPAPYADALIGMLEEAASTGFATLDRADCTNLTDMFATDYGVPVDGITQKQPEVLRLFVARHTPRSDRAFDMNYQVRRGFFVDPFWRLHITAGGLITMQCVNIGSAQPMPLDGEGDISGIPGVHAALIQDARALNASS
jgi:hypothetical protein